MGVLPKECSYQTGVVTKQVLLPNGCCYQTGIVTEWVLLPNGFWYQTGAVNNRVFLKSGLKTDYPYVISCWLSINHVNYHESKANKFNIKPLNFPHLVLKRFQ